MSLPSLTPDIASRFSRIALAHVERQYPNKLDHVLNDAGDLRSPRDLHPIFYGSFDWHSCVHGYWLLATMLRRAPEIPEAAEIRALFDRQLSSDKVGAELAYLSQPLRATFERPYGWAWLLMLSAELARHENDEGRRWRENLEPLTHAFVARFRTFLPKATYPIRAGAHFNTAFAVALAAEYARTVRDESFAFLLKEKAMAWYDDDIDCQAWEPGGDDFLSPALIEAECMRRVLAPADFRRWFDRFLPRLADHDPGTLFVPATVSDRTDGKIGHLDGVNLSRAWCWRSIAGALDEGDRRRPVLLAAAREHLDASLPQVAGDYMGEHWLATFAALALEPGSGAWGPEGRK
jgi:hypothetical protein